MIAPATKPNAEQNEHGNAEYEKYAESDHVGQNVAIITTEVALVHRYGSEIVQSERSEEGKSNFLQNEKSVRSTATIAGQRLTRGAVAATVAMRFVRQCVSAVLNAFKLVKQEHIGDLTFK